MARVWRVKSADNARYLDINLDQGGTVVNVGGVSVTTVGSPVAAYELAEDSRELADIYVLTVSAVNLGVTPHRATVTVTAASGSNNPYHGVVWPNVAFDGTTPYETLIPGVILKGSASGSLANGWKAVVHVGIYAGILRAGNPGGIQMRWTTGYGTPGSTSVSAGEPGFWVKALFVNEGSTVRAESKLVFRPRAKVVNIDDSKARAFKEGIPTQNTLDERTVAGGKVKAYRVTFSDRDVVDPDTITMYVDSGLGPATITVRDIGDLVTGPVTSTAIKCDSSTQYVVTQAGHGLEGWLFCLEDTAADDSEENVLVFAKRHIRFRADDGTPPAEEDWVDTEIYLTPTGEATPGYVDPTDAILVDIQIAPDALAPSEQNPFPGDLIVESVNAGPAGWKEAA
jgi:hypothetical protein